MGNLPDFRLTAYSPTFTDTRLDFFWDVADINDGCGDSIGIDEPIRGGECSKGATSTI
jgi:hypothetical protein